MRALFGILIFALVGALLASECIVHVPAGYYGHATTCENTTTIVPAQCQYVAVVTGENVESLLTVAQATVVTTATCPQDYFATNVTCVSNVPESVLVSTVVEYGRASCIFFQCCTDPDGSAQSPGAPLQCPSPGPMCTLSNDPPVAHAQVRCSNLPPCA